MTACATPLCGEENFLTYGPWKIPRLEIFGLVPIPAVFEAIANAAGENFFDAGSMISTDEVDGIHFTADANRKLGTTVAEQVELLLQ